MKTLTLAQNLEAKYLNPALWDKIQQIDLQLIIDRMCIKYKWSQKRVNKAIDEYRQFLYIGEVADYSVCITKESTDLDDIWHQHILHTQKYEEDCYVTFGHFVHHLPTPSLIKSTCVKECEKRCEVKCGGIPTQKAFCGFAGDGDPKPSTGSGGDCKTTDGSGGDCKTELKNLKKQLNICDGGGGKCRTCHHSKNKKVFCGVDGDDEDEENCDTQKSGTTKSLSFASVQHLFFWGAEVEIVGGGSKK